MSKKQAKNEGPVTQKAQTRGGLQLSLITHAVGLGVSRTESGAGADMFLFYVLIESTSAMARSKSGGDRARLSPAAPAPRPKRSRECCVYSRPADRGYAYFPRGPFPLVLTPPPPPPPLLPRSPSPPYLLDMYVSAAALAGLLAHPQPAGRSPTHEPATAPPRWIKRQTP
jgi:hypothetical protein